MDERLSTVAKEDGGSKQHQHIGFKMRLHSGCKEEYKRRHDNLWPELKLVLKEAGIQDYSIFLDAETNTLFGTMTVTNQTAMESLPDNPVMRKWWAYMKDIMETNNDDSPVSAQLEPLFYLP